MPNREGRRIRFLVECGAVKPCASHVDQRRRQAGTRASRCIPLLCLEEWARDRRDPSGASSAEVEPEDRHQGQRGAPATPAQPT
jgi:hypothetical protein